MLPRFTPDAGTRTHLVRVSPEVWDQLLALFRRMEYAQEGTEAHEACLDEFRQLAPLPPDWQAGDHIRWQVVVPARSFVPPPRNP